MKLSIKGFFSNCDQIRRKLRIWTHSLKKSLLESFNFGAVFNSIFIHSRLTTATTRTYRWRTWSIFTQVRNIQNATTAYRFWNCGYVILLFMSRRLFRKCVINMGLNQLYGIGFFLFALQTSENQRFSGFWCFQYIRKKESTLLKVTLLHACFLRFLNCTNGTKLCNASHINKSF